MLRATKTHRTYRVAINDATIQPLVEHRRRVEARAAVNNVTFGDDAFVFSAECHGSSP